MSATKPTPVDEWIPVGTPIRFLRDIHIMHPPTLGDLLVKAGDFGSIHSHGTIRAYNVQVGERVFITMRTEFEEVLT